MSAPLRTLWNVRVPMRDGVTLSCDITLPAAPGRYPALLHRTPYDNTSPFFVAQARFFAAHGYAFVFQDMRGRGDSDGEMDAPLHTEGFDGYDTIEWIAAQTWCDGKVGTLGGSIAGEVQWHAARERPPHLVAMASSAATGRIMEEYPYKFGKFAPYWIWWLHTVSGRTNHDRIWGVGVPSTVDWDAIFRTRPLRDADLALGDTSTAWREWLAHNTFDDYWQRTSIDGHFHAIDLPVLHITGWYDNASMGAFFFWDGMRRHSPAADRQWLVVGPWDHRGTRDPSATYGEWDFGDAALPDIDALHLRWFDHWLKGHDTWTDVPRARLFVIGRNAWHDALSFPAPGSAERKWWLHGDGSLSPDQPGEGASHYTCDPEDPTPSRDPARPPDDRAVSLDTRYAEARRDVLVFTSAAAEREWVILGTPYLILYAASDCADTDFMATLCDVHPDGRALSLGTAVLRVTYRDGSRDPQPIAPGEVLAYRLEFPAIGIALLPGHRLRVMVHSSWYPEYDLNPNTGARQGDDAVTLPARQTIWHDAHYPSHLLLPVLPAQGDPDAA
jgi:putative CocE/NonD family hydrolase